MVPGKRNTVYGGVTVKQYQCKIIIKNSKPPIWWRCLIPGDISFSALSIILDELTGAKCEDSFSFDMLRIARIWEPTKEKPLQADFYHAAYSAAHTSLKTVFDLGKTVNYHCGDQTYRIEVEDAEDGFKHPILLLLKVPWHVNGLELSQRLDRRIHISKENGMIPLKRHEIEEATKEGTVQIGLVQTNPEDEETVRPSSQMVFRKIADALSHKDDPPKSERDFLFSIDKVEFDDLSADGNIIEITGNDIVAVLLEQLQNAILDAAPAAEAAK